jgi:transcription elongation factor Elf1
MSSEKMAKAPKAERAEAFRDHRSQLVLSKFLSGELAKLDPVYDPAYGYTYPVIEAIVGDPSATVEFLTHLYELGILKRQTFDKMIYCPSCSSANVSIRYCCPYCKSFNIKKSALIEHIPCGYIDTEDRFKKEDKLVCPRCHTELNKPEVNYRRAGVWCACNDCGKSFDIPVPSHFCRVCGKSFTFEEAVYRDVYSYSLNEEIMKEAGVGYILVAPIKEFLQNRGFTVESPGFLKGKSGASHMFDIAASRGTITQNVIVIDLATAVDEPVSEQSIIAMFAKIYDVAPDKACLIAIPRMSDSGRKLAELYNIKLIEAKDQNEAIKALEKSVILVQSIPSELPPASSAAVTVESDSTESK